MRVSYNKNIRIYLYISKNLFLSFLGVSLGIGPVQGCQVSEVVFVYPGHLTQLSVSRVGIIREYPLLKGKVPVFVQEFYSIQVIKDS